MEEISLKSSPASNIWSLLVLAIPIFLISFSGCLLGFLERIWLSQSSLLSIEASLSAAYILKILQAPCIALALMNQVFVGYYHGANQYWMIGRCTWQMIWFSLFSMLITLPLSIWAYRVFFKGTEIEYIVKPYFFILSFANFLFPLGTTLLSFYLGRGKLQILTLLIILTYALNLCLDKMLIFGTPSWIPPMGLKGTALAAVVSQGLFCVVLIALFLNKANKEIYGTHEIFFQSKSFWKYISPAIPRAFGRFVMLLAWAACAHIMTVKGGEYLLNFSIGGTISLFLSFIGEGLAQSLTVLVSNAKGAKDYLRVNKLLQSAFIFIVVIGFLLAFPLVIFPEKICSLFSLDSVLKTALHRTLFWVWINTIIFMLNNALMSIFLAFKDTVFLMIGNLCVWLTGYLPTFFAMNHFECSPDKFWMLATFSMMSTTLLYIWRMARKKWLQPITY